MRRVIAAVASTAAALVLLLSFKTHSLTSQTTPAAAVSSLDTTSTSGTGGTGTASSSTGTTGGAGASTSTSTSTGTTTVTGDAVQTRYGPVQVKITVTNGKVTAADAVVYPQNDPRDQQINSYAVPVLDSETVAASSASINAVSGATYTSDGYVTSLQSALDKAGL